MASYLEEIVKTVEYRVRDKLTLGKLNEVVNDAIVKGIIPRTATVSVQGIIDGVIIFRWLEYGSEKEYSVSYKKTKYGSMLTPYKDYKKSDGKE